ncbi:unnamed protein product [Rotaria sp. Silwood1]|nr:unnamed protein product [Rotaria sp. Silwood1]CAF1507270.1 unnamed protein product [Rotaria sp. Silwood1]CAF1687199.1 unnamed protein product [Rotaria sp. Silwood1]CAF1687201.1 unnamed protein product [Rotaria sp. Silwood1]
MPKNQTKFNLNWLSRLDENKDPVKIWLKAGPSSSTFKCTLCQTNELDCGNQGWKAVEQHMKNVKHKQILHQWKENVKFVVSSSPSNSSSSSSSFSSSSTSSSVAVLETNNNKHKILNFEDQVIKAEILWALNIAQRGFSYSSCNELNNMFSSMFPDSSIAAKFSIQSNKMSYVISHGLGPYFKKKIIDDVKKTDKFVLIFDEQTNNQNKKQLDMWFRYWCNEKKLVVNRFYKTVTLGHAYARTIRDIIIESFATDGLDLKKLLMLSRDNPNVNIALEKMIDSEMQKQGSSLLKLGSCSIHIVHNAFKNGLLISKWHVENFCLDLYSWFKCSPARQEDFKNVLEEIDSLLEKTILYFSITRWILMGKVVKRIIKPLVHVLYHEMTELFRDVLSSFLKIDVVQHKSGQELLNITLDQSNLWRSEKEIRIGEQTTKLISSLNFDEKKSFYQDVRKIYETIGNYLKKNLPLDNILLRDLQVLNYSSKSDATSNDKILRVARAIPNLFDDKEIDNLTNEWILYCFESIDESWIIKDKYVDSNGLDHIKYHSIDYYWSKVFSILTSNGTPKYQTLAKLIRNVLIVAHGNADVERGFSINSHIVTDDRTLLSETSINGLRLVHDGVKYFGSGSTHKVPITSDMINVVKKSSSNYRDELLIAKTANNIYSKTNNNNKELIQIERQQQIEEEKKLLDKQKDLDKEMKEAEYLIQEGTNRLENGLKNGSLSEIYAAKLLIAGGHEKITATNEKQRQVTNELDKLRLKRKDALVHEQSTNKKLKKI